MARSIRWRPASSTATPTSSSASASGNAEPRREPDNQEAPGRTKGGGAPRPLPAHLAHHGLCRRRVGWKHSYEVWIDANKDSHRRNVARKKVNVATAKSDCDDRRVREAR